MNNTGTKGRLSAIGHGVTRVEGKIEQKVLNLRGVANCSWGICSQFLHEHYLLIDTVLEQRDHIEYGAVYVQISILALFT